MATYVRYEHHGHEVSVREDLKGLHREYCLCWHCQRLSFDEETNCPVAQEVYRLCCQHGLTLVMWECPQFVDASGSAVADVTRAM